MREASSILIFPFSRLLFSFFVLFFTCTHASWAGKEGGREASSYTHADNDQLCMNYDALSFTYAAADAAARSAQRRFESSPDC